MTLPATTADDPRALAELRARTGGPQDDGPRLLEHALGWTLVVVLAMLVTQVGLL
ncbi:SCO1431 family membrane protein [Streptomyces sp. NPDC020719]|uniref:SCO1431 family membrane protein n=1 Tax=unclassified Streptomyces TaxID=2593676 RepID=UPI0033E00CD2